MSKQRETEQSDSEQAPARRELVARCELSEDQFNELVRLRTFYSREAERCGEAKAYLGGCVMIGAALEAELMVMCHWYSDEIPLHCVPKDKHLTKWTLSQLLRVAGECGWLPAAGPAPDEAWDRRKAKIGDYAEVVRRTRNLVHAGRYLTDFTRRRVTKNRLETYFEILDVAHEHLEAKVHASLREALDAEERAAASDGRQPAPADD